jgi:hypothetical protein
MHSCPFACVCVSFRAKHFFMLFWDLGYIISQGCEIRRPVYGIHNAVCQVQVYSTEFVDLAACFDVFCARFGVYFAPLKIGIGATTDSVLQYSVVLLASVLQKTLRRGHRVRQLPPLLLSEKVSVKISEVFMFIRTSS